MIVMYCCFIVNRYKEIYVFLSGLILQKIPGKIPLQNFHNIIPQLIVQGLA